MSDLDEKIACYYAPKILQAFKHGECCLNVWFPGTGKFTTTQNIFTSKKILSDQLGPLYKHTKIVLFSGSESLNGTAEEIYSLINKKLDGKGGKNSLSALVRTCEHLVNSGWGVLLVGVRLESLAEEERKKILLALAQVVSVVGNRVCTLLNVVDKPFVENLVVSNPAAMRLMQNVVYLPMLSGPLLPEIVNEHEKLYGKTLSPIKKKEIISFSGGIITLTKDLIRNYPDRNNFEVRFKVVWQQVPALYKEVIKKVVRKERICSEIDKKVWGELKKMGLDNVMKVFKENYLLLEANSADILPQILTSKEKQLLDFFNKAKGHLVSKDEIAQSLWDQEAPSDWAISQLVARLRQKLAKVGLAENLETWRGRGYRWIG